jgi:hypothetical protein
MHSPKTLSIISLIALLSTSANAWWGTGHMIGIFDCYNFLIIVARIAYDYLQVKNASIIT